MSSFIFNIFEFRHMPALAIVDLEGGRSGDDSVSKTCYFMQGETEID